MTNFSLMVSTLKQNIARAVVGKDDVVELMLTALLCEGHVLIEDVPGVGKTTLASALARSLSCSFKRIQFTPDITPSDITGFTMPSLSGDMQYRPGAIMSQIVLADEINRTSPKTQSALLEVMEERQVTVDGVTYPLARPFMVLATQNPVDFVGTYPLPEAQMDRFFMRVSIGYPSLQDEMDILDRYCGEQKPMESVVPVCSAEDVIAASGIEPGDNLLLVNKATTAGNILAALPYVEEVRGIVRSLPDTVVIQIQESEASFAVQTDVNTTWLVNSHFTHTIFDVFDDHVQILRHLTSNVFNIRNLILCINNRELAA